MTKRCTRCGKKKPIDEFARGRNRRGVQITLGRCLLCERARIAATPSQQKARQAATQRRAEANTPEAIAARLEARRVRREARLARARDYWRRTHPSTRPISFDPEVQASKRRARRHAAFAAERSPRGRACIVETFDPREIFERDGWRCHVCGEDVSREVGAHDQDATIDHLIPVVLGGDHSRSNVALAHRLCNSSRADEERIAA